MQQVAANNRDNKQSIQIQQMSSSIRDFVPLAKLGEGTFSTVYKKIYALKKVKLNSLSQKQKENALNEIRILASFECSNIVAYKEAFFDDKVHVLCIVMEFADGGDLHKYITDTKKDYRRVNELCIWKVAADILGALEHLHGRGILHRDLKSANIFIHGDEYKLGDLNVSKVNGGRLAYTQTGTPYYASPQVWRDEPYDQKSDIWSFGCILYELTCLKPPFQGKDLDQLYKSVQKGHYPSIPQEYSLELAEVIDKCLQKNPRNRPKASQLLEHNRKNSPIDEKQSQKELLRTIKLPSDLRALKMNLPSSKYDDKTADTMQQSKRSKQKVDTKNYISDRPNYPYQNKSRVISPTAQLLRNQSQVVSGQKQIQSPKAIVNSEVFLSPRNYKKSYQHQSLNRSPEEVINRKIASAHISNSDKKTPSNYMNVQDFTDRKSNLQANQNYSERRVSSQKKSTIIQKYDKFIQQELEKKPMAMPRTEKRIISSQGRYQNPGPVVGPVGVQRKEIEQWRRKLVKKGRVFSNNIFSGRPGHEVR